MQNRTTTARRGAQLPSLALLGCLALPLTTGALTTGALTSGVQKSDEEVRREIEFARGLAADWSFVDLSEEVIKSLESQGLSSGLAEKLGLVKCEVFAIGAKNERDATRRNELFESALAAYEQFITANPTSEAKPDAEAAFVDVSANFSRALEIAQEDAVAEEATALKERQIDVLTAAVSRTGDLISNLTAIEEKSEVDKRKLYTLMLNRGQMLLEMGKTQEDGVFSFEQSLATLEDLVFAAGEATPFALRAYVVIGDNYSAQQDWESASAFYEAVVDQAIPIDEEVWKDVVEEQQLTQESKEIRWLFVQLGTGGLVRSYAAAGEMDVALKWGLHMFNVHHREGFSYQPIGYLSVLEVARKLTDAGGFIGGSLSSGETGWYATLEEVKDAGHSKRDTRSSVDLALSIAKEVNENNRGNNLQLRAQKLISDIIGRPGVVVPPGQLFEAAEGEYYEKNYPKAVAGFKRVLRSIDGGDQALRTEFGPKTLFRLGASYRRMNRPLEAAMAFREGCADNWLGDPEYDSRNAKGFYDSMIELQRRLGQDDLIKQLVADAEAVSLRVGTENETAILFKNAQKARRNRDFQKALELYQQIPVSEQDGEPARVYVGVCRFRMGQTGEADTIFADYLDTFVTDPKNVHKSEARKLKRKSAMALASFYRGLIAYNQARSGEASNGAGEAAWQRVIQLLEGYYEAYSDQDVLAPWVSFMTLHAHLQLNDRDPAKALYELLVENFPQNKWTGKAAITFYKILEVQLAASSDSDQNLTIEREMAQLLQRGNTTASSPNFDNLRRESRHWSSLEEFAEAERVLRRILTKFEDDSERTKELSSYIRPDLARALLGQLKLQDAKALLAPLVAEGAKRPSKQTLLDYCRAVTGWVVEDDKGAIQIVAGAGETDEEFQKVTKDLDAISRRLDKWACEWYAVKFDLTYAYYVWGERDSRKRDSAKAQLRTLEQEVGSAFALINQDCDATEDPSLKASFGGDVLRRRYLWLRTQLN